MPKRGIALFRTKTITAPASLLKRFAAYIIDFLIINFVIIYPFRNVISKIMPKDMGFAGLQEYLLTNQEARSAMVTISAVIGVFTLFYFTYFEYKSQQTPGKMLMKNYIVPVAGRLTFWNYLLSNLVFIPVFPFFFFLIADFIYMIFSKTNQRFTEKLANISVMEKYEVAV
jgi:uncharacterized RDD family membrane protein YckC